MYCQNRVIHRIEAGDSLYQLARQYHTTVTELILLNAGVNPYNLQIGKKLVICPGEGYEAPDAPSNPGNRPGGNPGNSDSMPGGNPGNSGSMPGGNQGNTPGTGGNPGMNPSNGGEGIERLREEMRLAWLNHVVWARLYLISPAENLENADDTLLQLLANVDEITAAFANNYSPAAIQQLKELLTEHVQITGNLIDELKKEEAEEYNHILPDWYENGERIADFLSRQTAAYDRQELRDMIKNHLDILREEIEGWFEGDYRKDIEAFIRSEKEILSMADYLAGGLLAR